MVRLDGRPLSDAMKLTIKKPFFCVRQCFARALALTMPDHHFNEFVHSTKFPEI